MTFVTLVNVTIVTLVNVIIVTSFKCCLCQFCEVFQRHLEALKPTSRVDKLAVLTRCCRRGRAVRVGWVAAHNGGQQDQCHEKCHESLRWNHLHSWCRDFLWCSSPPGRPASEGLTDLTWVEIKSRGCWIFSELGLSDSVRDPWSVSWQTRVWGSERGQEGAHGRHMSTLLPVSGNCQLILGVN